MALLLPDRREHLLPVGHHPPSEIGHHTACAGFKGLDTRASLGQYEFAHPGGFVYVAESRMFEIIPARASEGHRRRDSIPGLSSQ